MRAARQTCAVTAARPRLADPAERALAAIHDGTGALLLVTGPAGAGKTHAAHHIHDAARAAGLTVCWAVCGRAGAPPFWPWTQVLRRAVPAATLADHPLAGRLLDTAAEAGPTDLRARFELFDDVTAALADAVCERPTVVLLDDLHEADAASLLLLEHVSAVLRSMPLLIVTTVRTDLRPALPEWDTAWPALVRRADALPVGPLDTTEIAQLLERATGRSEPAVAARIEQRTGGNALFVCELVRLCATSGGDVDALPETVRAVIAARVAERSGNCRRLLSLAAAYGSATPVGVLAGLLGEDVDAVLGAVDEAVQFGVLERRGSDLVAFVHDIVRDAVYDGLPAAHRGHWHRLIADRYALAGAAANAAHHYRLAGPDSQSDAATWFARAGDESLAMLAYEDAATQFRAALSCTPTASGRVQVRLGAALLATGDAEGARAAHLAALETGRRGNDADLVARAALGLSAGTGSFEVALFDRQQIEALEEALELLGDSAPAMRAAVLARLCIALTFTASVEQRAALADEAVRLARANGDDAALAVGLAAQCDLISGPEHCAQRLAMSTDVIDIANRLRDASLELLGRRLRIVARLELGDGAGTDEDIAAYHCAALALRQPLYSWYVPLWNAALALAAGQLDEAAAQLDDAEHIGARANSVNAEALVPSHLFIRYAELDDKAGLRDLFAVLDSGALTGPWVPISAAYARSLLGEVEAVRADLDAVVDRIAALPVDGNWLATVTQGVEAIANVGGHPAVQSLYVMLQPYAELYIVEGIGCALRGSVHRHLGLLAAMSGDRAAAVTHFEAAVVANKRIGAHLLVARTYRDAGRILSDADWLQKAEALSAQLDVGGAPPPAAGNVLRRDGETWTVEFAGKRCTLRDSKGLRDLAVLLGSPGHAVPALDLATVRGASSTSVGDAELHEPGDLGDVLDERARRAYRDRLRDLEEEAAEADAHGDVERATRVAAERDAIVAELGAAYGLAGRPRRAGSPVERARTTVTARIRDSIRRIAAVHPELGRHLASAVHTGTLCRYEPERPVIWQLTP